MTCSRHRISFFLFHLFVDVGVVQDMTETVFEETEVAKTVREIRARDPNFDMVRFLRNLKQDVAPVIQVCVAPFLNFGNSPFQYLVVMCIAWQG